MPGRLASFVHVRDEQGVAHVFGPGDEVPDWAAARITNPKAWAEAPEHDEVPSGSGDGRPPKTGQGSSREVWAAYAIVRGLDLPADATRDQIIAAVEAADQQ